MSTAPDGGTANISGSYQDERDSAAATMDDDRETRLELSRAFASVARKLRLQRQVAGDALNDRERQLIGTAAVALDDLRKLLAG